MSYVVHVTAVVEGDIDKIEGLINQYRYKCLENQPGMQQILCLQTFRAAKCFSLYPDLQRSGSSSISPRGR